MRSTRAIIDLNTFENNIKLVKSKLKKDVKLMAIVKANAYGHGIVEIAHKAIEYGADYLGVAILEEGLILRENGISSPILILGTLDNSQIDMAIKNNISVSIYREECVKEVNLRAKNLNKVINVHIKVDTGMNRIGLREENEVLDMVSTINSLSNINLEGIFTHLSSTDEEDQNFTQKQIAIFNNILKSIDKKYGLPKYIHAANTGGTLKYPDSHYNMVRVGIGIYGYANMYKELNLKPILSLHSKIAYLKSVKMGSYVGYDRNYICNKNMVIATISIGYGDGYPRSLSNKGSVLIKGQKAKILGNVCMDQIIVDVTDIDNVKIDDEVIIIGDMNGNSIDANEIAEITNTIPYEILTNINLRIPRIYREDNNYYEERKR